MGYHTGEELKIIITTENVTYGLNAGAASDSPTGIYDLDAANSGSATITNVTALTENFNRLRNDMAVFGQKTRNVYPIKYVWEITMTRPKEDDEWKKAWELACNGVTGSAVFKGLDDPKTDSGFRVNLLDLEAGDSKPWAVGYGGVITGYTTDNDQNDIVFENITLQGNNWEPMATGSFGARTAVY